MSNQYQILLLCEQKMDHRFLQAIKSNPSFATTNCLDFEHLLSVKKWEPPDFIFLDEKVDPGQISDWISVLFQNQWHLPVMVATQQPELWEIHPHPYLLAIQPTISSQMLLNYVDTFMSRWESWTPPKPLSLYQVLEVFCETNRTIVTLLELEDGERAFLEIKAGQLNNVTLGTLQGEEALFRVNQSLTLHTKWMEIQVSPFPRKISADWRHYFAESSAEAATLASIAESLETRDSISRKLVRSLLPGLEEEALQLNLSSVLTSPVDHPTGTTRTNASEKIPFEEATECEGALFDVFVSLVNEDFSEASVQARKMNALWPDQASLRFPWIQALLTDD